MCVENRKLSRCVGLCYGLFIAAGACAVGTYGFAFSDVPSRRPQEKELAEIFTQLGVRPIRSSIAAERLDLAMALRFKKTPEADRLFKGREKKGDDLAVEIGQAQLSQDADATTSLKEFNALVEKYPDNPRLMYYYAKSLRRHCSDDSAKDLLQKAVKIDPLFTQAHLELAKMARDRDEIMSHCAIVIMLEPAESDLCRDAVETLASYFESQESKSRIVPISK